MVTKAEYIYGDTDSVFFTFNLQTLEGKPIRGKEALAITIELAQEAGHLASSCLKAPHSSINTPFKSYSRVHTLLSWDRFSLIIELGYKDA